jgi:hypothetical protein
MKKNIIVYGLIAGIIVSILMLFNVNYISHCEGSVDYDTSMLIGYASMVVAFSLVFVGIRNYRDKYNGGVISFGKAFKVGILIVLIAFLFFHTRFYGAIFSPTAWGTESKRGKPARNR